MVGFSLLETMRPRVRYSVTLLAGVVLAAHAFLYDGVFTEAGLVSFLDPVGAISPMPYGTYHVGIGIAYATTAVLGFWGSKHHMRGRSGVFAAAGAFLAACAGMTAFWSASPDALQRWWESGFVLATAQIALFPLRGTSKTQDGGRALFGVGPRWGLTTVFRVGTVLAFLPLFAYGLAGLVAGGWGVLNALTVLVVLLFNGLFGYPLTRLGHGFSGVDGGNVHAEADPPDRSS